MDEHSTTGTAESTRMGELLKLFTAHRCALRQEPVYRRVVALAEFFVFARHTVTQSLWALGVLDGDWRAWYRLFSRPRFAAATLAHCLFEETLPHVAADAFYVVGVDTTQVPRSSQKMPGTSWLRAVHTAIFCRGLHRAQRFLQGAWLPPIVQGYTRAIPLRFLPAFPAKAVPAEGVVRKEWETGIDFVTWVRQELDGAGRLQQWGLLLADGAYETVGFWRSLPHHTIALVRTAPLCGARTPAQVWGSRTQAQRVAHAAARLVALSGLGAGTRPQPSLPGAWAVCA